MTASSHMNLARLCWNYLFGPPKVRVLADGTLRVRLLGRVFEAPSYEVLIDSVSREREHLLRAVSKVREGAGHRAHLTVSRLGPGDLYLREVQRIEDRLAVYNDFLGHLMQRVEAS